MVKKMHKSAEAADSPDTAPGSGSASTSSRTSANTSGGLLDSQLAQTVKDSAQQIWLAGLGAFAKAQSGGSKVFDALKKEGASVQRKTQSAAEETLADVAGKMTAMAGEVGHKANAQWDKLETIFEERTARALGKLGVPSARALAALESRVDALAAAVAKLGATASPATKRAKPVTATKATKAAKATQPPVAPVRAMVPKFRAGKAMAGKAAAAAVPAPVPVPAPAAPSPAPAASRPARKRAKPTA